jgi:hypothetical protein
VTSKRKNRIQIQNKQQKYKQNCIDASARTVGFDSSFSNLEIWRRKECRNRSWEIQIMTGRSTTTLFSNTRKAPQKIPWMNENSKSRNTMQ